MLILLLSSIAPGFSSLGHVPFSENPLGNLERMVLPALRARRFPSSPICRGWCAPAMLDALGQDYVRTARAKGVSERSRRLQARACAMRSIPFFTSVGIMTGYLLGGAIVVEQVFAIPGLGRLILGAIAERNYPLIQATILVVTAGFVLRQLCSSTCSTCSSIRGVRA